MAALFAVAGASAASKGTNFHTGQTDMILDPNQLESVAPSEILNEIVHGRLDIDHRVLHALLGNRGAALPALLDVVETGAWHDSGDLEIDLAQLFHALEAPEGIPFLIDVIRRQPDEVLDEVAEALHFFGALAVEPLLSLYGEFEEENSEEIAFLLASLHIRDERIYQILLERFEYNAAEGAFLLGMYGDVAARERLEQMAAALPVSEKDLKKELDEALRLLTVQADTGHSATPLDIYSCYPAVAELPIDLFSDEERLGLFNDHRPSIRAAAAHSFFNQRADKAVVKRLLSLAQSDPDEQVRSRAWEGLMDATENTEVVEAMLAALRNQSTPVGEKACLLVGLSAETDRNEVRLAMEDMYKSHPECRAKVLESMWRSLHPAFREYFVAHLQDQEVEVRRSAVWGVGYYAIRPALDGVRAMFDDEQLRSDAIFAYGLALPTDISKGRMKGLLKRIEKDAGGLSEIEERLVMTALDERMMLEGKEPVFFPGD